MGRGRGKATPIRGRGGNGRGREERRVIYSPSSFRNANVDPPKGVNEAMDPLMSNSSTRIEFEYGSLESDEEDWRKSKFVNNDDSSKDVDDTEGHEIRLHLWSKVVNKHTSIKPISAVLLDGNKGVLSLGIAIVEAECGDSWKFFKENLLQSMGRWD
ncbi:hypothetical protein GH714_013435 [Hevea brasiliensis]|uniref:MULE transposase domain-containing protein n=1 Tax=Hevea brasiliensis TaxID=3981 RepID=A0A6A6KQX9_HEVBR|nr:hypothetical protein GH714_013435 [Hevea brasiliensis]